MVLAHGLDKIIFIPPCRGSVAFFVFLNLRGHPPSINPAQLRNEWQEGRADAYCLIDQTTCELMGYPAMTFAIELLTAVCQRLADFDGKLGGNGWDGWMWHLGVGNFPRFSDVIVLSLFNWRIFTWFWDTTTVGIPSSQPHSQCIGGVIRPTSKLQLACFAAGSTGYDAHTDGSNLEELDQSMPEDQRNMISSRSPKPSKTGIVWMLLVGDCFTKTDGLTPFCLWRCFFATQYLKFPCSHSFPEENHSNSLPQWDLFTLSKAFPALRATRPHRTGVYTAGQRWEPSSCNSPPKTPFWNCFITLQLGKLLWPCLSSGPRVWSKAGTW